MRMHKENKASSKGQESLDFEIPGAANLVMMGVAAAITRFLSLFRTTAFFEIVFFLQTTSK